MSGLQLTWIKRGERGTEKQPLLVIENLTVRVGMRRVLDAINLEVFEGDHLRIAGPNGCGKSTLLNAIAGLAPARIEYGRIRFGGSDITTWPTHERAKQGIAYMRQTDHVFPSLTVRENLIMALGQSGYERFAEAFPEWATELPPGISAGILSGGQKKKLALGMTVCRDNIRSVLLDEPQTGLDVGQRAALKPPENLAVLVVEHYFETESNV